MGKGVLLERDGRCGVVLTPEGEFRRVRLPRPAAVGEEIEFADRPAGLGHAWRLVAAVAAVLVLAAAVGPAVWRGLVPAPAAMISVDINPSAEFDVDRQARVVAARPLNDDAAAILADRSWRRQPADQVVAWFVGEAVKRGKLVVSNPDAAVLIAVAPVADPAVLPPEEVNHLEERVKAAAAQVMAPAGGAGGSSQGAQLVVVAAPGTEVAAARAEGLSLGRHLLYSAVRAERPDLPLTPEDTRKRPVGDLVHLLVRPGEKMDQAVQRLKERVREQEGQHTDGGDSGNPGKVEEGDRTGARGQAGEKNPWGQPALTPGRAFAPDRGRPESPSRGNWPNRDRTEQDRSDRKDGQDERPGESRRTGEDRARSTDRDREGGRHSSGSRGRDQRRASDGDRSRGEGPGRTRAGGSEGGRDEGEHNEG